MGGMVQSPRNRAFARTAVVGICISIAGCQQEPGAVAAPAEAKAAFDSQEGLGKALERRWPISSIKEFCIPERRHNPLYQLLVMDSDVIWSGPLHSGESTGFDKIEWTANTTKVGRAKSYIVIVHRGNDLWSLEIGNEQSLTELPNVSPDPNQDFFVNHNQPLQQYH